MELFFSVSVEQNNMEQQPWNSSVRVAFSIPRDAAQKLKQLAREGSSALRLLGIQAVQLEGDNVISLKIGGHENNNVPRTSGKTDFFLEFYQILFTSKNYSKKLLNEWTNSWN